MPTSTSLGAPNLRNLDPLTLPEEGRSRVIAAADAILAGRWRVFDRARDDMAETPDWFLDPRTGLRAPQRAYAFDIDHRRVERAGDAKYVWETSRHHHLTVLAAAYFITRRAAYAECIARHLRSWWDQNPFLSGMHWTSGIELGLRLIAWVWVRRLLDGWVGAAALFEKNPVFLRQLHHHQDYISSLRSHGSSANNHLLAEMAGQFTACCALPYFPETARWRRDAARHLTRALQRQTFPSGLNRELATGYHGFVLEVAIAAALEGEASGHALGADAWQPIQRMTDALAAIVDTTMRPPRQGDDDDGQGLLLDAPEFDRWSSLLSAGDALFGARPWWPAFPRRDLRSVFWAHVARAPEVAGNRPEFRPSSFPDAGMVILRDRAGKSDEIWCRCDHGPHGYLAIAAHAHADALAVEVRHGGLDILADPGTFMYFGASVWRDYFRSTLGHNTLELSESNQSVSGGDFLWMRHASAALVHAEGVDGGPSATWRAVHDGYKRLRPPARHDRSVRLDRDARRIVITDSVEGQGAWPCRLAFHLGPSVECSLDNGIARLEWSHERGPHRALLRLPGQLAWTAAKGQTRPPLGWYSPSFGTRVPSTTLVGCGNVVAGILLVSELRFDNRAQLQEATC